MTTIFATLVIIQEGTTISLRSSVAEEHENSVPAKLVEIAQDAVSTFIAETCDVPKARTETVWDSKQ